MKVKVLVNSKFASTSNLIVLPKSETAWLVDCGDAQPILEFLSMHNLNLMGVLLTHGHFDHIYGLNELTSALPTIKVFTNHIGAGMLLNSRKNLSYYNNTPIQFDYPDRIIEVLPEQSWNIGDGFFVEALFTPGHNPSCITWIAGDAIFTGDSYIPGLKTVTNLPASNKDEASLSELKIIELAKRKTIYPGHSL